MKEVWKDVVGYEGIYKVSNLGRVKSLDRIRKHNIHGSPYLFKGKILNQTKNNNGYLRVFLCKNNKSKTTYVHRLVASHFHEKEEHHTEVNHIDGDKKNNIASNLEWCTKKENLDHGYRVGLWAGENNNTSKLKEKDIPEIFKLREKGMSAVAIAEKYNVHKTSIHRILAKTSWRRTLAKQNIS